MKKRLITILLCCWGIVAMQHKVVAQAPAVLDQVMAEMKKIQAFYNTQDLSFGIKYTYANEHEPGKVLDSLSGEVEMAGASYRYSLDNMETIRNERYSIILFKEDKVMYLAKPGKNESAANPMELMKAALERTGINSCEILRNGHFKTIRILFGENTPYRKMELTIDTLSGYLLTMQYIVKTAMLMDKSDENDSTQITGYDEYAIVSTRFEHYRKMPADRSRFDEHTFFYREGEVLKTTKAYQDYSLFVGTPNL